MSPSTGFIRLDACPLCDSPKIVPFHVPLRFVDKNFFNYAGSVGYSLWAACETCSLLFQNPCPDTQKLEEFYRISVAGYTHGQTTDAYTENELYFRPHTRAKVRRIVHYFRKFSVVKSPRILELGCGFGKIGLVFREMGMEYTGTEPSDFMRQHARSLGLRVFASLDEVPNRDFDLIVSHHVLEHIPVLAGELCKMRSLGNQSCVHVHIVPAYLKGRSPKLFDSFTMAHLYMFNPASIHKVFRRAGFDVVDWHDGPLRLYDAELWVVAQGEDCMVKRLPDLTPPSNEREIEKALNRSLRWSTFQEFAWYVERWRLQCLAFFTRRWDRKAF